ncbi:formimidoylglutamate deiminase [Stakelama marina]|uniref:Formimidoylglutamate deiminase n=1 Tax=Stakelama marina TaxID=2826939 RepID=A0A8T4ICR7_9SPHN|nr:formimidoylglutamate deiminase [Stakelama marina]MBR0552437.1 formimidoylglutamate deiminase [Stakelama marina]
MTVLWFESALIGERWESDVRLRISNGKIHVIEPGVRPDDGDERHAIGIPGLPNLHSHAFQRAMAGLTEHRGLGDDDFWTWRDLMYHFLDRLDPDDVEAIAALAYVEMLETGSTRVGEFHYLHHDPEGTAYADRAEMASRIAAAAGASGIGLTLLPVFYAYGGFGGAEPGHGQRRFLNDVDGFARLVDASRDAVKALPDPIVGIAPHSLRAVTPEELAAIVPLAGGKPVHIHAAEQQREVDDCIAWCGRRPVEWLLGEAGAGEGWCLVHATQITDAERQALAKSGAVAGLCPITEANLGDGIFPAHAFIEEGGAFGIGSDSNVLIDAAEELRTLEYGQRLMHRGRNLLASQNRASTGASLFAGAVSGGARALGISPGIAVGGSADIVSFDPNDLCVVGRSGDALLDGLIFAGRGSAIDCVWRHGEKVVSAGRHLRRDAIETRYRETIVRLLAS